MTIRNLIVIIVIMCNTIVLSVSYGQSSLKDIERIQNREVDSVGIDYLGEDLMVIGKREKPVFYRYVYYYKGMKLINDFRTNKRTTLEVIGNKPSKDSIVLMNGTYNIYNKHGQLISRDLYSNGYLQIAVSLYPKSGNIYEEIDYNRKFNNQEGSYTITIYRDSKEKQILEQYYFGMNDKNKWTSIPISSSNRKN